MRDVLLREFGRGKKLETLKVSGIYEVHILKKDEIKLTVKSKEFHIPSKESNLWEKPKTIELLIKNSR